MELRTKDGRVVLVIREWDTSLAGQLKKQVHLPRATRHSDVNHAHV